MFGEGAAGGPTGDGRCQVGGQAITLWMARRQRRWFGRVGPSAFGSATTGASAESSAAAALCKFCCKRLAGSGEGGAKRTEMSEQQRWWRRSTRSMRSAAEPMTGARGVCGRQGCRYGGWRCRRGRGGWEQGAGPADGSRRQGGRVGYRAPAFEGGCGAAVGIPGRSKVLLGRGGTPLFAFSRQERRVAWKRGRSSHVA